MNLITVILDILLITLLGFSVGKFLFHKNYSLIKIISLSYSLGFGIVGLQLLIYDILKIPWSIFTITIPWFLLVGYSLITYSKKIRKKKVIKLFKNKLKTNEKLLFTAILLLFVFVGIESIIRPIQAWDGWDNWVLRSNVFYQSNSVDKYYFKYTTDEYPLIIPLVTTFGYISFGQIDDKNILLFYFMFYLTLSGMLYSTLRQFTTRYASLLMTFLFISTQNAIRHGGRFEAGQADLAVGLYILVSAALLFDFIKFKTIKSIILLNILLAITAQIKNDAIPFVLTAFVLELFILIYHKFYSKIIYIIVFPLLIFPWQYFKIVNDLHANFLFREGIGIQIGRAFTVILNMSEEFFNFKNWNFLWVVFIFYLLFLFKINRKNWIFFLAIAVQFLAYFMIFLITPTNPTVHIANVINKLYLHLAPLAVIIFGIDNEFLLKNLLRFKFRK